MSATTARHVGLSFRHGWPTNKSESVQPEDLRVGDAVEFRVITSGWAGSDWWPTWGFVSGITEKSIVIAGQGRSHRVSRVRWYKHSVSRYVLHHEGDMRVSGCRFCELSTVGARVIGSVYVVPDAYPVTQGHYLVIPLRHCDDYFDMAPEELADTHRALCQLRADLLQGDVTGFNVGWNCGSAAGQTVQHAHCHLIPRRLGDMPDPAGGVRGVIPERQKYARRGRPESS